MQVISYTLFTLGTIQRKPKNDNCVLRPDVRVKRGADAATDHHLIVAKVKLKLKKHPKQNEATGKRFNISMLANKTEKSKFQIELKKSLLSISEYNRGNSYNIRSLVIDSKRFHDSLRNISWFEK